jgi:hypothetical protein
MSLLIRTNLRSGGTRIINLLHVSTFDWHDKTIKLGMSYKKQPLFGSFLFFQGERNEELILNYSTKNDAEKEFNELVSSLDNYYQNQNLKK